MYILNEGESKRMKTLALPGINVSVNRRIRLAYHLSLLYLAFTSFFICLNYFTGQWVLGHINVGCAFCYLAALILVSKDKQVLIAKSLISIGAVGNVFLISSVLGLETGNYLWYFPTACVIFLLFGPEKKSYLFMHLGLLSISLFLLQWTDFNWLIAYREPDLIQKGFIVNLVTCLITIGFCMYYSQTVNQQIESDLQQSENNLNTVLNSLDEIVWIASLPDKKLIYVNAAVERITGYTKQALLNNFNWCEKLHPDDQEKMQNNYSLLLQQGFVASEYRIFKSDGSVRWLSEVCKVIVTKEGIPVRIEGTSTDVTEQKLAQFALKESEANLQAVLENTTDMVWSIDTSYRLVTFNSAFQRRLSDLFKTEVTKGSRNISSLPETIRACWISMYDHVLAGNPLSKEMKFNFPQETIYAELSANPIRNTEGIVVGASFFGKDVTKRKKQERELVTSQTRFQAFMDHSPTAAWITDPQGQIIYLSKTYSDMFLLPVPLHEAVGKSVNDLFDPPYAESYLKNIRKVAQTGQVVETVEKRLRPNGSEGEFLVYKFPIPDLEGGDAVGGVAIDINERVEAEAELKRINFELDSFVYRSSHDLRAPLMSVLGLVNLVRSEEHSGQRSNYLTLMEKSIRKLDTFITDMTNFSRNTRQQIKALPIDFRAIIAECAENLRYMEHADRVSLHIDVEGEPFFSDPQRISTVFQNLMSNSVKYQRLHIEDAYIHFKITCTDKETRIVYSDNGKGIDQAYLDKIFDMFFRASSDSYGSGLGLYITQQVVKKLNGTVSVQSELGRGTTFTLTLPNLKQEVPELVE